MLLVNKPKGITSHDVVDEVRRITGVKKVGHAGTLDPFAEGLLIVLVGREETRTQGEFLGLDKVYEATFILGAETDTFDSEGEFKTLNSKFKNNLKTQITKQDIKKVLKSFEGEQMQMPPDFSAKKIKGKKAYELARQGKEVNLEPKRVKIYWIELLDYETFPPTSANRRTTAGFANLKLRVKVSSGTYIRALARDIGRELGTGAYAKELVRTQIGDYKLKNAKNLKELKN